MPKWKFWKREEGEEEYPPFPQRRKPQTLSSVSDKILIREMRRNPSFGLEMAMRTKHLTTPESKNMIDQLKDLKELQKELKGLGIGDGDSGEGLGGWLKSIVDKDTLQIILAVVAQKAGIQIGEMPLEQQPDVVQKLPPQSQQLMPPAEIPPEVGAEVNEPVVVETAPEPKGEAPLMSEFLQYVDLEPEEVVQALIDRQDMQGNLWLNVFLTKSYHEISNMLLNMEETPEISALMHVNKEDWWKAVIYAAKNTIQGTEVEG